MPLSPGSLVPLPSPQAPLPQLGCSRSDTRGGGMGLGPVPVEGRGARCTLGTVVRTRDPRRVGRPAEAGPAPGRVANVVPHPVSRLRAAASAADGGLFPRGWWRAGSRLPVFARLHVPALPGRQLPGDTQALMFPSAKASVSPQYPPLFIRLNSH